MDGIILIDKAGGPTSAEVVRVIKRAARAARVGHLGTLDPFATGLLPIMLGEGTKLAPFIQETPKVYQGLIVLGAETDSLDRTGTVTRTAELPDLPTVDLEAVAARFTGEIDQVPPVFSAIKRDGVPLYKLARRGEEMPPPPPRRVTIHSLTLKAEAADSMRVTAACSAGTYIRSLARDIGLALGTVAHLGELRRLRCGIFAIEQAHPLAEVLAALADDQAAAMLIGLRESLAHMPEVQVDEALETRLRNGDSRALDFLAPSSAARFKVIAGGRMIAVAEAVSRVTARMLRGFNPSPAV
jgi:tRNA pseudouridine55 synthase